MEKIEPSHVTTLNNLIDSCIRANAHLPNTTEIQSTRDIFIERVERIIRESGLDSSGVSKAIVRIKEMLDKGIES